MVNVYAVTTKVFSISPCVLVLLDVEGTGFLGYFYRL